MYKMICAACFICSASCSSIKPNQIKLAENYATVIKGVSTVPQEIYFRMYQLKSQSQQVQLSGLISTSSSAKEMMEYMEQGFMDRLSFLSLVDSIADAHKIVSKYSEFFLALIDKNHLYSFTNHKKEWQASFDLLTSRYNSTSLKVNPKFNTIPPETSGLVASIINEIGSKKIKSLQKKYLFSAMAQGKELLKNIYSNFLHFDIPRLHAEMNEMPSYVKENYQDFLANLNAYEKNAGQNPYNYYKYYMPIYNNWQLQIREAGILINKMESCIKNLVASLDTFEQAMKENVSPDNLPTEIEKLNGSFADLKNTQARFEDFRLLYLKTL